MSEILKKQRFGSHLSIAGGLHNALLEAVELGCDCLQIFTKNQRQWKAKPLSDDNIKEWHRVRRRTKIRPVVAHATYLINLAASDPDNRRKSIDAFADELDRSEKLGLIGLVVHPGAHLGDGETQGLDRIVESLDEIHARQPVLKVKTLLETTAGQGTTLGYRLQHLAYLIERVEDPARMGVCLDTAHLFEAGYDFRSEAGYKQMMKELTDQFDIRRVRCIHVNDSATELGSRVDRHAHIGKGHIGSRGFRHLVNDRRLARAAKILETPKGRNEKGRPFDRVNLERLRRMVVRK
jgi:deoxyribonuclease-4